MFFLFFPHSLICFYWNFKSLKCERGGWFAISKWVLLSCQYWRKIHHLLHWTNHPLGNKYSRYICFLSLFFSFSFKRNVQSYPFAYSLRVLSHTPFDLNVKERKMIGGPLNSLSKDGELRWKTETVFNTIYSERTHTYLYVYIQIHI